VSSLTGAPDGLARLRPADASLLPALLRRSGGGGPDAPPALAALVNLSADAGFRDRLLEMRAVPRAMDALRAADEGEEGAGAAGTEAGADTIASLLLALLTNLTAADAGAEALLQLGAGAAEGFHLAVLVARFLAGAADGAGPLLANVTRLSDGRRLLASSPAGGLTAAAAALVPARPAKARAAAAAAIRNCCLAAGSDGTLGELLADQALLRSVLKPVAGLAHPDDRAKASPVKDDDCDVRTALAEAVLALAATEEGRAALWSVQAPELLRLAYEDEEDPDVCTALEHAATLFLEGAGSVEEVEEEEGEEGGGKAAPAGAGWANVEA
jgi:hypothetical protein